jgi:nitroimidazol reductase NimA-like FMN-containing flavoprotein (pyridoxamine 5'-phosphate oxidase superfamily)
MTTEELERIGVERMDDEAIEGFLSSRSIGVLGLPHGDVPYLLPLSFAYDGERSLYFTYLVGPESRKQELSERADRAVFLVYDASSKFMWQSVQVTGTLTEVPATEWEDLEDVLADTWRPAIFEPTEYAGGIAVYRFDVTEWAGFKQTGLPPGLERPE